MAMRNYYCLPRLGEKACTFGFPTGGVDLCNSEWQEAGRAAEAHPAPAAPCGLGRPRVVPGGPGWPRPGGPRWGPGGPPGCRQALRGLPVRGRRRGQAAALSRRGAGGEDGWPLDAGCLLEASRAVRVWTPLTHCWHIFPSFFLVVVAVGRVTSSCVWS